MADRLLPKGCLCLGWLGLHLQWSGGLPQHLLRLSRIGRLALLSVRLLRVVLRRTDCRLALLCMLNRLLWLLRVGVLLGWLCLLCLLALLALLHRRSRSRSDPISRRSWR